jgi:hypothetical protein
LVWNFSSSSFFSQSFTMTYGSEDQPGSSEEPSRCVHLRNQTSWLRRSRRVRRCRALLDLDLDISLAHGCCFCGARPGFRATFGYAPRESADFALPGFGESVRGARFGASTCRVAPRRARVCCQRIPGLPGGFANALAQATRLGLDWRSTIDR